MIAVESIPLSVILPSMQIRMVLMQPYVHFAEPLAEPLGWKPGKAAEQLNAIERTLALAGDVAHPQGPAHFTVFPEYAVPGLDGVALIDAAIRSSTWSSNTVVIAGIDGLDKTQYRQLCTEPNTNTQASSSPDTVQDHEWVNCCVTWAKDNEGRIARWIQAKVRPAWIEINTHHQSMFCGSSVFLFEARFDEEDYPCNFLSLICFDWVAKAGAATTVWQEVVQCLQDRWKGTPGTITWMFVPQANPKPNHDSFISSTYDFLTSTSHSAVDRRETGVVLANIALCQEPQATAAGGYTALVYGQNARFDCDGNWPSVCTQPQILRSTKKLACLKDAVFREAGACIHSFRTRVPRFLQADVTDRCCPVEDAYVYSMDGVVRPRTPNAPVPACLKWVHDELDTLPRLADTDLSTLPLAHEVTTAHDGLIDRMRSMESRRCEHVMRLASPSIVLRQSPLKLVVADKWTSEQSEALSHVANALSAFGIVFEIDPIDSSLHAALKGDGPVIQVAAVRGQKHEECVKHFRATCAMPLHDPVVLITRDESNLVPMKEELERFTHPADTSKLRVMDYQTFIQICRAAQDSTDLAQGLKELLDASEPQFV